MTRKTKIRIVVVVAVVSVAVVASLQREFSGDVRVIYVGVSPQGSDLPTFTITNSFRKPVVYYLEGEAWTSSGRQDPRFYYTNYTGHIEGRSTETIVVKVDSSQPWRLYVAYNDSWISSFLVHARARLARLAAGQKWTRLSKWLAPPSSFRHVSGPALLGNKPAEVVKP